MTIETLLGDMPSLPLVSFGPGNMDEMFAAELMKERSEEFRGLGIPHQVVKDILVQNAKRRHDEASRTFMAFHNDQSAWDSEMFHAYIQFRIQELDEPTAEDRINLFLDTDFIRGYEFYARLRLHEKPLLCPEFATKCLSAITRSLPERKLESKENIAYSLPKITRKIGRLAVVTSKMTVGTLTSPEGSKFALKSRQAGVMDLRSVPEDIRTTVGDLANAENKKDDRYVEPRKEVLEYLQSGDSNASVQPIVESLYLSR